MSNDIAQFFRNPITSKVSLLSTARGNRPKGKTGTECPFCAGNEDMTPPAIFEVPEEKGKNSRIRIVPNKYPLLPGGAHDVIIDHDQHTILIPEMGDAHLTVLFSLFQKRMAEMYAANQDVRLVQIFKNFGRDAGGSLPHTHSQMTAIPLVPHNIKAEINNGKKHYRQTGRCIFCDLIDETKTFMLTVYDSKEKMLQQRVDIGRYIIDRSQHFMALVQPAPSHDYEVWIIPLMHHADFLDFSAEEMSDFAGIFRRTMARLHAVIENLQYNFFIHSLPHGEKFDERKVFYHTHLEIVQRMTPESGFEKSTRLYLLEKDPAAVAEQLRNVQL